MFSIINVNTEVTEQDLKKELVDPHFRSTVNKKVLKFYLLIVVGSPTADAATT